MIPRSLDWTSRRDVLGGCYVSESGAAAESDDVPSCSAALRGAEIDLL